MILKELTFNYEGDPRTLLRDFQWGSLVYWEARCRANMITGRCAISYDRPGSGATATNNGHGVCLPGLLCQESMGIGSAVVLAFVVDLGCGTWNDIGYGEAPCVLRSRATVYQPRFLWGRVSAGTADLVLGFRCSTL